MVKNISRPKQEDVDQLASLSAAPVHEVMGKTGLLKPYMPPLDMKLKVCGPAVTVICHPGDNLMIHAALRSVSQGTC